MAHGRLRKVKIVNKEDSSTKIKREFFLPKSLYNEIVDKCYQSDVSFSSWVCSACSEKIKKC